jgi:hypothetical protein
MPASLTGNQLRDPGLNKFLKTNLYYTEDKYLLYQDPTWLGFKLLFEFDQKDSRLMYSGPTKGVSDNIEEFIPNTAYTYLRNIGDLGRAKYLSKFVNHLRNINETTPWFFQTIEGLGEAWKRGYQDDGFKSALPKDRKITIGCLESIDLRMSALMDLYRKACFDWQYRREMVPWNLRTFSVYIYVYELRKINRSGTPSASGILDLFELSGISEINERHRRLNEILLGKDPFENTSKSVKDVDLTNRSGIQATGNNTVTGIKDKAKAAADFNPIINESSNTINENVNRFLFKFKHCEWLPDESGEFLSKTFNGLEISNMVTQKISFSYRDVEEINVYNIYSEDTFVQDSIIRLLDSSAADSPILLKSHRSGNERRFDRPESNFEMTSLLNSSYNTLLAPFASLAVDQVEGLVNSFAGKLLMGNVYGFSPTNLAGNANFTYTGNDVNIPFGTSNSATSSAKIALALSMIA